MDGDADQVEREVADRKAELAAEVERLRTRALDARRTATRRGAVAAAVAAAGVGALRVRRRRHR
ncbi:MAG TPA: hypothetical protein VH459_08990 [Gaiellales bacterium]|jgi:hypothetical protein